MSLGYVNAKLFRLGVVDFSIPYLKIDIFLAFKVFEQVNNRRYGLDYGSSFGDDPIINTPGALTRLALSQSPSEAQSN